jgi:hypothetical protein
LDPAEQLARDGAVLLERFEGEPADVERLFGQKIEEVSGPLDYEAGTWDLEPGDVVVSHRDAKRFRKGTGEEVRSYLDPGHVHVAALPGTFALSDWERYLLSESGVILLRAWGGDVEAAARRVGKPVGEVTGPVDYISRSHSWPARGDLSVEYLGELHEAMQTLSWDFGPGDVAVAHGNMVRLRKQPYMGAGYDEDSVIGSDLGEEVVHVAYEPASPLA